jgi:hypothetical protein
MDLKVILKPNKIIITSSKFSQWGFICKFRPSWFYKIVPGNGCSRLREFWHALQEMFVRLFSLRIPVVALEPILQNSISDENFLDILFPRKSAQKQQIKVNLTKRTIILDFKPL